MLYVFKLDGVSFWCLHNKNMPKTELCQICTNGILPAVVPEILEPSDLCKSKTDTQCQLPGDVKKRFSHFVGKATDLKLSNLPTVVK